MKDKMKENKKLEGVMVFYVDVGQLPPYKAEAFIDRMKDQFGKTKTYKKLKKAGVDTIWMPVRPNSQTRVEFMPMTEGAMKFSTAQFKVEDVEISE